MDANLKKILRSLSLELRHVFEGRHDGHDVWHPGDLAKAIADRATWRADERRWCREAKLPRPGWWPERT